MKNLTVTIHISMKSELIFFLLVLEGLNSNTYYDILFNIEFKLINISINDKRIIGIYQTEIFNDTLDLNKHFTMFFEEIQLSYSNNRIMIVSVLRKDLRTNSKTKLLKINKELKLKKSYYKIDLTETLRDFLQCYHMGQFEGRLLMRYNFSFSLLKEKFRGKRINVAKSIKGFFTVHNIGSLSEKLVENLDEICRISIEDFEIFLITSKILIFLILLIIGIIITVKFRKISKIGI